MKKVKILIFDTETAGLPKNYKPAEEDLTNYPPVMQLGAQILEVDLDDLSTCKLVYGAAILVSPFRAGNPIVIDPKAQAVHGISFAKAEALGDNIETVAYLFQGLCNSVDFIVCHNYSFDKNIMVSELLRLGIEPKYKQGAKVFCTMKFSTNLVKIPNPNPKYPNQFKFPRLEELFKYLFNISLRDSHQAHDAYGDVEATRACLIELIKRDSRLLQWFKGEIAHIY